MPAVYSWEFANRRSGGATPAGGGGVESSQESWYYRSTMAGVFRGMRFPSAANVNAFRFSDGIGHDPNPTPGSVGSYVRWNSSEGIFGDGALELEQLSGGNMNSYLWLPFDANYDVYTETESGYNLGPGQEFYFQWAAKTNCGGQSSTGGGGRKFASVSRLTNSYTFNELVLQDTLYRGIVQMYQGRNASGTSYAPIDEPEAGGDFDLQPGSTYAIAPAYCSYQAGNYPNQAACVNWHNNQWVWYLLRVIPSDDGVANGTVELSFWMPGMVGYKKIISRTSFAMVYDADKPDGYNAALFWIYETGRTSGPAGQMQWYDQAILSRAYIPPPNELPTKPTWYVNMTDLTWAEMSAGSTPRMADVDPCPANNCTYTATEGQNGVVDDWCGAVVTPNAMLVLQQGGHFGYAGNEGYKYTADVPTPGWARPLNPSTSVQEGVPYYADGRPTSVHGYNHSCFIGPGVNGNRYFAHAQINVFDDVGGVNFPDASSWVLDAADYEARDTYPDFPGNLAYESFCDYDRAHHRVWIQEGLAGGTSWRLFSLDAATRTYTTHGAWPAGYTPGNIAAMVDPVRRLLVGINGSTLNIRDLARPGDAGVAYTVTGLSCQGIKYEPRSGKWVCWNGGKDVKVITPPSNYRTGSGGLTNPLNSSATYSVGQTLSPVGGATPTAANANGTYGRFNLLLEPFCLIAVNSVDQNVYIFKLPAIGLN